MNAPLKYKFQEHSLQFNCSTCRDIILEKHYKSVIHRSICDYFFDAQKKVAAPEDVPPVIPTPHHYLFNIYHNSLYLVAVTLSESESSRPGSVEW